MYTYWMSLLLNRLCFLRVFLEPCLGGRAVGINIIKPVWIQIVPWTVNGHRQVINTSSDKARTRHTRSHNTKSIRQIQKSRWARKSWLSSRHQSTPSFWAVEILPKSILSTTRRHLRICVTSRTPVKPLRKNTRRTPKIRTPNRHRRTNLFTKSRPQSPAKTNKHKTVIENPVRVQTVSAQSPAI